MHDAIARAKRAARVFAYSTPHERRLLLNRLADGLAAQADRFAETLCFEVGKTIHEARREVVRAQNTLRLSAEAAGQLDGEVLHCAVAEAVGQRWATVTYQPVGVVGAITPFNYPLNLLCHKLGPALGAGNAVVVKPSPKAPLAAWQLVQLLDEISPVPDLVQCVHGDARAAMALAGGAIDLLSFTGGPNAGLALKRASGLVRCLMELGGNDPLLVLPDADLQAAAHTAVAQRLEIAGQSCAAVKKLYVHHKVHKAFVGELLNRVAQIRTGDPMDPDTQMGPVIDDEAAGRVSQNVRQAIEQGAIHRMGVLPSDSAPNRLSPVVLDDVPPTSTLWREETFGPVLALRRFDDLESVIEEINASGYGLQAGIFSNDHAAIRRATRLLQVGGVLVNDGPDTRFEHIPFGGMKSSGMGREGVRITMREMSETKVVIE